MSESTLISGLPSDTQGSVSTGGSDRARWVLLVGWIVMLAYCVGFCPRDSTLHELTTEIRDGRVDSAQVGPPGVPAGSTGSGTQQIYWRHGILLHRADVLMVTRGSGEDSGGDDQTAVRSGRDITVQLHDIDPRLQITRVAGDESTGEVYGWYVARWPGYASLGLILATLVLLISGPQPLRATRWAWFWLMTVPVGTLLFLVLSGPTPGIPAPRPGRRPLRAGWAIVLAIVAATFLPTWWPRD